MSDDVRVQLLPHQHALAVDTESSILVLKGGLRAGKTFGGIVKSLLLAEANWPTPHLVVEPTYQMVRDVFLESARAFLHKNQIPFEFRATDHVLTAYPDSDRPLRMFLRSLDKPERMIGFTCGSALVDEWESCTEEGVIRVQERITPGADGVTVPQLVLSGTPEGFGFGYRWCEESPLDGLRMITARTADNFHVDPAYIARTRLMLSEAEARERLEGIRTAKTGTVYGRWSRSIHAQPHGSLDRGWVEVWADFNVDPMVFAIVLVTDREAHVVKEVIGRHTDTLAHGELTRQTIGQMLGISEDAVRRLGVTVVCDASGASRSSNSTQSDVAILQRCGFRVRHPAANPPIADRVAAVNLMLAEQRLLVDPKGAPYIARCLESQPYDSSGQPDKSPKLGLDHGSDVVGYGCHFHWPASAPRGNQVQPKSARDYRARAVRLV